MASACYNHTSPISVNAYSRRKVHPVKLRYNEIDMEAHMQLK